MLNKTLKVQGTKKCHWLTTYLIMSRCPYFWLVMSQGATLSTNIYFYVKFLFSRFPFLTKKILPVRYFYYSSFLQLLHLFDIVGVLCCVDFVVFFCNGCCCFVLYFSFCCCCFIFYFFCLLGFILTWVP